VPLLGRGAGSPPNTMWPGPRPTSIFVDFSTQEAIFPTVGHTGCACSKEILLTVFMAELRSVNTSADFYRQHCAKRKAPVFNLLRPILRFFAPQGRHVAPMG